MNYARALQALKDLYQLDPAVGSRWTETADLEDIMYWAGRIGKGFADRHIVTYDPANGYQIAESQKTS
jgi:hypothetical protein